MGEAYGEPPVATGSECEVRLTRFVGHHHRLLGETRSSPLLPVEEVLQVSAELGRTHDTQEPDPRVPLRVQDKDLRNHLDAVRAGQSELSVDVDVNPTEPLGERANLQGGQGLGFHPLTVRTPGRAEDQDDRHTGLSRFAERGTEVVREVYGRDLAVAWAGFPRQGRGGQPENPHGQGSVEMTPAPALSPRQAGARPIRDHTLPRSDDSMGWPASVSTVKRADNEHAAEGG